MNHSAFNYVTHMEDEIALEGLDGITIQGLWLRLSLRHNFTSYLQLDDDSKNFLWKLIIGDEEIEFYTLEEPRPELKIFNRYEYMDSELGLILEPKENIPDIYPCVLIDDVENGIRGSCITYKTRKNVTDLVCFLSLKEAVEKYGNKLVMVASQFLREKALGINAAVCKFYDLQLNQYIMLERIGRSRAMGEITHGKNSLNEMKVPAKTMFYYRKRLLKLNLITKQSHRQRSEKGNISSSSLLHLTRFYVIRRPKFMMLIQKVVEKLKMKPNFMCPLVDIKEEVGIQNIANKKVLKCGDFQKHIQTVLVPYRQIYPNATVKEWKCKSKSDEKMIRCAKLINPSINVEEMFAEEEEHEEGHGGGDDEDEDAEEEEYYPGILNHSNRVLGRSLLQQSYYAINAAGPNGLTTIELSKKMGLSRLDSRTVCRALLRRNAVHSLMKDMGRQRVSKHVSNKYANTGHLLKEYQSEMKKMLEIVQTPSKTPEEEAEEEQNIKCLAIPSTSRVMEANNSDVITDVNIEVTSPSPKLVKENQMLIKKEGEALSKLNFSDSDSDPDYTESCSVKTPPNHLENIKKTRRRTFTPPGKFSPKMLLKNKTSPHLTTRMMKRANIIMNAIRKQKVIDDSYKLQKMIISAEESEGLEAKMDKKSLMRLIDRLSNSGYVKNFVVKFAAGPKMKQMNFAAGPKIKQMNFIVDSSITKESKILQLAIDQHYNKFMLQASSGCSTPKRDQGASSSTADAADESGSNTPVSKELLNSPKTPKSGAKGRHPVKQEPSVGNSVLEMEEMHNLPHVQSAEVVFPDKVETSLNKETEDNVPNVSIKGNVGPKFVRLQEFHKLLFYLVYGYEGKTDLDQSEAWIHINNLCKQDFSTENFNDYPTLYLEEVSWKMFIPPLRSHPILPVDGWVFIVDVLLRIPLSIFVQIVSVTCESRLLMEYLNHPIKCNLLVRSLPPDLRRYLLNQRRYVTYVMDLCKRLCYIGLLQMGKQIMKEKDQVFVYLNKNASLVDTTISDPGYTNISLDKDYVSKEYVIKTVPDVIQYWFDMWTICMHTPLGAHGSVEGKNIDNTPLHKKPEMIESTKPRDYAEAPQRDNGRIPGDQRGAAGLDSSMYAHLRRNWSCSYSRFSTISQNTSATTEGEKSSDMFSYAQYLRNSCTPESVESSVSKNKLAGVKVRLSLYKPKVSEKEGKEAEQPIPVSVGLVSTSSKRKKNESKKSKPEQKSSKKVKAKGKSSYVREFKARVKGPKKPYYDEEDKAALRRMNKLRVDWSPAEDSLLLLCKVSSAYLFPHKKVQIINFCVVRDLLHSRFPESRNKTSKACQRRINYILKNPATEENVAIILEELKQDEEITNKFKPAKLSFKLPMLSKLYENTFKKLVNCLVIKYASNERKDAPDLPNNYSEFTKRFKVILTANSLKEGPKLNELTSVNDIDHYVVNALIFSSLCTKQDRESWAYQLYLVYQKYPNNLLTNALTSIRESKMISYKKCYNRSKYIRSCLPLSTSPFQLSLSFVYMFHMKYTYDIIGSCWNVLKMIVNSKAEALVKIAQYKSEIEKQSVSDASSPAQARKTIRKKRKGRKIGIRVKTHGKGKPKKLDESPVKMEMNSQEENSLQDQDNIEVIEEEKGISLSSNLDGGYCSCILSLSAISRIQYSITIPEQLIAIDNQSQEKICPRNKLLEKIEYRELVSGKKFDLSEQLSKTYFPNDEDIYTDKNDASREPVSDVDKNLLFPTEAFHEESSDGANVNEDDEPCEENIRQIKFEESQKEECQRPKQSSNSRILMYMMRDMCDDDVPSSVPCDNIFINICDISCQLKTTDDLDLTNSIQSGEDVTDKLMPVTKEVVDAALAERKKVVFTTWMKLEHALEIWRKEKKGVRFISNVKKLFHFIESKKDLGATASEIQEEFPSPSSNIMKVLREMEDMDIILKVGVQSFQWVTVQHSKHWLIHTNKMSRAKMNSTHSVRLSGVYDVNEAAGDEEENNEFPCQREDKNQVEKVDGNIENPIKKAKKDLECSAGECPDEISSKKSDQTSNLSGRLKRKRGERSKIALLKRKGASDAENAFNMENNYDHEQIASQYEEIDVLVRPWVRLNGCLNRRVMDRMLGAVMFHVMENPGNSGRQISKRFWPALQPAHTYELLETLLSLGAVKRMMSIKFGANSLFSEEQDFDIEPPKEYFNEDYKYEAEVDCVLKLSTFIGDKKYTQEFLDTCR